MGNSGFRKLGFADSYVETPYKSLYEINAVTIDKQETQLKEYFGKKCLIVNVASNSPIKEQQVELLSKVPYQVLLFPTNDFRNEPNNYATIKENFKGFTVFQKVEVNGRHTHPVYKYLKKNTEQLYNKFISNGNMIKQDFCKFLVDEQGQVVKYFKPDEQIV